MQIYSTNNWIFVSYVLHLSELKNETGTGVRCYVVRPSLSEVFQILFTHFFCDCKFNRITSGGFEKIKG